MASDEVVNTAGHIQANCSAPHTTETCSCVDQTPVSTSNEEGGRDQNNNTDDPHSANDDHDSTLKHDKLHGDEISQPAADPIDAIPSAEYKKLRIVEDEMLFDTQVNDMRKVVASMQAEFAERTQQIEAQFLRLMQSEPLNETGQDPTAPHMPIQDQALQVAQQRKDQYPEQRSGRSREDLRAYREVCAPNSKEVFDFVKALYQSKHAGGEEGRYAQLIEARIDDVAKCAQKVVKHEYETMLRHDTEIPPWVRGEQDGSDYPNRAGDRYWRLD
ncbi:hypothetical protein F5Y19DRAFT_479461 [Xylariaceae sp. FL1651]|nr:hypothetical protein F5Y19DRAFT_479461 [Xylariaceae sp. FL1651]